MTAAMNMSGIKGNSSPNRISDLLLLKQRHSSVTCRATFDVIPMYFTDDEQAYKALMFLCRFTGIGI